MKRTEILAWFLCGLILGVLIGLWLSQRPETPPAPRPDGAACKQPPGNDAREGRNISTLDFRHEGTG